MHKDLSDAGRNMVEAAIAGLVAELTIHGDSLALAREHIFDVFDRLAEMVDASRPQWKIGQRFTISGGSDVLRVTDVGSRVVVAMRLNTDDPSWNNGPPYAVVEEVFDEEDQAAMKPVGNGDIA